jgi:hypothetical protein
MHPVVNTRQRHATHALNPSNKANGLSTGPEATNACRGSNSSASIPNDSNYGAIASGTKFETTQAFGFTSRAKVSDDKRVSIRRIPAAHDSKRCF